MSNPWLRCSSSDVHSKTLDTTTRLHIPDNKADFSLHCSVAPKSGMRVTSLPLRTCMASLLKQPFFPPVASHILLSDPAQLAQMAENMRAAGTADAAERIADLVLKLADRHGK